MTLEGRVTMRARALLEQVPKASVGLVVTDPPWALQGAGKFDACANYPLMEPAEAVAELRPAMDALVPGGHLYSFAPAGEALPEVVAAFRADGWRFIRQLVWDKGHNGGLGAYRNTFEPVLVWSNGLSRGFMQHLVHPSLLRFPPGPRTGKPWPLYKVFVEMSSRPGELVVDPFCGQNPLARAATHARSATRSPRRAHGRQNPLARAATHAPPPRRWLAGDVLTPEQVHAQVRGIADGDAGREVRLDAFA